MLIESGVLKVIVTIDEHRLRENALLGDSLNELPVPGNRISKEGQLLKETGVLGVGFFTSGISVIDVQETTNFAAEHVVFFLKESELGLILCDILVGPA